VKYPLRDTARAAGRADQPALVARALSLTDSSNDANRLDAAPNHRLGPVAEWP